MRLIPFLLLKCTVMEVKEVKENQNHNELYPFLKAVRGNWHNAMYLSCRNSTCPQHPHCGGFLMTADADGHPILMPVDVMRSLSGEDIEPEGCLGTMEKRTFETLYSLYIEWHTDSQTECPLQQLHQAGIKTQT